MLICNKNMWLKLGDMIVLMKHGPCIGYAVDNVTYMLLDAYHKNFYPDDEDTFISRSLTID